MLDSDVQAVTPRHLLKGGKYYSLVRECIHLPEGGVLLITADKRVLALLANCCCSVTVLAGGGADLQNKLPHTAYEHKVTCYCKEQD
jgi:hypothetical protein